MDIDPAVFASALASGERLKRCRDCDEALPLSEFYAAPHRKDGHGSYCKPCHRVRVNAWEAAHPEKTQEARAAASRRSRRKRRFSQYGLDAESFERMLVEQGGACALCGKQGGESLAIDHCHETGRVRGLLCRQCNTALGMLGDTLEALSRAAEYLA